MAARRTSNLRPGVFLLALAIAVFLWAVAQGSTDITRSFSMGVEIHGVKDGLVVTDQSADEVSVQVMGSRAALQNLDEGRLKYEIDVSNAKPGVADFEVVLPDDLLPRGARFASKSPSRIQVRLELRSRKEVPVVADVQGEPAEGFQLVERRVQPDRVWLAGARSHVMRLAEVMTEPIDVAGMQASEAREVQLVLGGGTVWLEEEGPVTVQLVVEPRAAPLSPEVGEGEMAPTPVPPALAPGAAAPVQG